MNVSDKIKAQSEKKSMILSLIFQEIQYYYATHSKNFR